MVSILLGELATSASITVLARSLDRDRTEYWSSSLGLIIQNLYRSLAELEPVLFNTAIKVRSLRQTINFIRVPKDCVTARFLLARDGHRILQRGYLNPFDQSRGKSSWTIALKLSKEDMVELAGLAYGHVLLLAICKATRPDLQGLIVDPVRQLKDPAVGLVLIAAAPDVRMVDFAWHLGQLDSVWWITTKTAILSGTGMWTNPHWQGRMSREASIAQVDNWRCLRCTLQARAPRVVSIPVCIPPCI